jgi:hypothetical protein
MKVISGGQTGADIAGLRAAQTAGLATGGKLPKGCLTENGPRPEYLELYGMAECETPGYPARTEANVRESDATLWFGSTESNGAKTTLRAIAGMGRPHLIVKPGDGIKPSDVAEWIASRPTQIKTMNIAGNRESVAPGIEERVERFLAEVFRRLGDRGRESSRRDYLSSSEGTSS